MHNLPNEGRVCGLYAVTPDLADTSLLLARTRSALAGGVRLVQYRNKAVVDSLRREQAKRLLDLCREAGAVLIINDHVDLAREIDADGVHVGADDVAVSAARLRLGNGKIVGASCYDNLQCAHAAAAQGADYIAFGSFFASSVKPGAVKPPISILTAARKQLQLPVVAIGGITLDNAGDLIRAGADAVAVISALYDAPEISIAAQDFGKLFQE